MSQRRLGYALFFLSGVGFLYIPFIPKTPGWLDLVFFVFVLGPVLAGVVWFKARQSK